MTLQEPAEMTEASACIATAAKVHNLTVADITGYSRKRHIVRARWAAAWLMRRRGMSLPQIGRHLNRDHTTIFYALRKMENAQ